MRLNDADRVLVLGETGTGKSHWVKERIVSTADRVVVWDVHAEYADDCDLLPITFDDLLDDPGLLTAEECGLAVTPDWSDPGQLAAQFAEFRESLKESEQPEGKSLVVVIEECSLLRPCGDGTLIALAAQSRHWRMPLVLVAQRATMIPPGARSQAGIIVSFAQDDPDDIAALEKRIGESLAKQVKSLPDRKNIIWSRKKKPVAP